MCLLAKLWQPGKALVDRAEVTSANDEWHKVREDKLRKDNLAQQRDSLQGRVTELEADCTLLRQHVQQDGQKRAPLEAKKQQHMRYASSPDMLGLCCSSSSQPSRLNVYLHLPSCQMPKDLLS